MSAPILEIKDFRAYFHTRRGIIKAVNGISYAIQKNAKLPEHVKEKPTEKRRK